VLTRMRSAGTLSPEQFEVAIAEQLTFAAAARPFDAPHFVEMVLAAFERSRPPRIETTLDLRLQQAVAGIIASHRDQLARHGANNVAVVVLDNASGEWLAWEGSGNYDAVEHGGRLNGPTVPRQPGSTLKPFTYAVAFEHDVTPATVLNDAPTHFPTADPAITYQPRNYDGRYRGPLPVREALGGSLNVPAVLVASEVGVPVLLRTLSRAGLTTLEKTAAHYGLGLTLGNAEVRLDELVTAYAAFARGGLWLPSSYIRRPIASTPAGARTLFSSQTAFWITDILSDAGAREEVFGRGGPLEFPFSVAVKTGTSQAYHDNWTIGYSRHVTVGVWVGNFNRAPLRNSSGVTGASPIFHAVMLAAELRVGGSIDSNYAPILEPPNGLTHVEICAESGLRAGAHCPMKKREWLPVRASQPCDRHQHGSPPAGVAAPPSRQAGLSIISPPDGSTYLIDPTLRREFQSLTLRAATSASGSIEWFVNGHAAGSAPPGESIAWPLSPGTHRVSARDSAGRSVEAVVTVR
jgi:penicillin-binding protein 1C